jgi:Ca2+-dependent lipid-binding protein
VGKTEIIKDSLNPKFIKNFQIEYRFEERQKFMIKVYDVDDFTRPDLLEKHDFIGELEFMLHEVVTARNQVLRKNLVNNEQRARNNGVVILTAEENQGNKNNEMIDFEMRV